MRGDGLVDGFAEVVEQVPSISDLDRVGRAGARTVGVGAGPVSADDLHLGMVAEPLGQRVGVAARQDLDRTVGGHVDQHRAVHVPTSEREIVDAQHRYRADDWLRHRAEQTEQGVSTGRHPQRRGEPGPGPAGHRHRDRGQCRLQRRAVASVWRGQSGDLLDEGPPRAAGSAAHEPTDP